MIWQIEYGWDEASKKESTLEARTAMLRETLSGAVENDLKARKKAFNMTAVSWVVSLALR